MGLTLVPVLDLRFDGVVVGVVSERYAFKIAGDALLGDGATFVN